MLKCDFHMHSSEDPQDVLDYDSFDLVNHAAGLGYRALAITFHGKQHESAELTEYANKKGVLLIPGIELYLEKREILLLGARAEESQELETFEDLRCLKKKRGNEILVIAPHPFYYLEQCLGEDLFRIADLVDAIEFCNFYTKKWNRNKKAEQAAKHLNKPMVACSDTHRLEWMKSHYCLLDAEQSRESIFAAIRAGKVQNVSRPMGDFELLKRIVYHLTVLDVRKKCKQWSLPEGLWKPRPRRRP